MTDASIAIDAGRYREVMGHYPTGVTVITGTLVGGVPVGMAVGTFTSVSLDPPLVAFMPKTGSSTFARLRDTSAYCINVLAHDQVELCRAMAISDVDKFDKVEWKPSRWGAPMLTGAVAHIHCFPTQIIEAGDHFIVLCRVTGMEVSRAVPPLLFFQGGYGGFSPHSMTAGGDAEIIAAIRRADVARPQIAWLARECRCEAAALVAVHEDELTTAASAYGGDSEMRERLGERLPLKPPVGEAYIAWAPPGTVERWLAKLKTVNGEDIARYRKRLEAVRARGFAASRIGPDADGDHTRLTAMMEEYRAGNLTPARERAILAALAEMMHFLDTADFVDGETYNLGGVVVPVRSPEGQIALLLRLSQLPGRAPGSQVKAWIEALRSAARTVEAALGTATT